MTDEQMEYRVTKVLVTLIQTDGDRDKQLVRLARIVAEQIRRGPGRLVETSLKDLERVVGL